MALISLSLVSRAFRLQHTRASGVPGRAPFAGGQTFPGPEQLVYRPLPWHGASGARVNRRRSIRWHLLQVQLVAMVPIGLFAAALLYFHWQVQEQERQRAQMETVRLLAAAVDNALDSTTERLSILARVWSSGHLSDQAMHAQAKAALSSNPDWSGISAFDAGGRTAFRTDVPFGAPLANQSTLDVWRPIFSESRPLISDVMLDPDRGVHVVAVGVPVVRAGNETYALVANLELSWYDRLMTKQGQPEGALAALIDHNFKFVARGFQGDERRGADPTPEF